MPLKCGSLSLRRDCPIFWARRCQLKVFDPCFAHLLHSRQGRHACAPQASSRKALDVGLQPAADHGERLISSVGRLLAPTSLLGPWQAAP